MKPNSEIYRMPLKQLLKLLETTADEAPHKTRRPVRTDAEPAAGITPAEPETVR